METKPLLSDALIDNVVATSQDKEEVGRRLAAWFRELTIDDRAEDANLIQALVDALKKIECDMDADNPTEIYLGVDAALSAAAARNFKPSQL